MRFWLGPWVWDTTPPGAKWRPPAGAVRSLDLRSLPQQGTPGPVAAGSGLFITADATNLGGSYLEVLAALNNSRRNTIRSALSLPQTVQASTRRALVLELLTRHAVVNGSTFAKPLMPNRRGRLRLLLEEADEDVEINTASPFWAKVQEALQEQYREYRRRALAGEAPENFHRKWLKAQLEKFRQITDYRLFIPSDLPDEPPLEHSTTITESFNKADSDTLGPDLTWTELYGDIDVASNLASCTTNGGDGAGARAESDLATDDHYCEVVVSTNLGVIQAAGPTCRSDATATDLASADFYNADFRNVAGPGVTVLTRKFIAGVETGLGGNPSVTQSSPSDTVRLEVDGSSLDTFFNGASTESTITDTSITGNTRCGIHMFQNTGTPTTLDLFEAGDLGAAPAVTVKNLAALGVG